MNLLHSLPTTKHVFRELCIDCYEMLSFLSHNDYYQSTIECGSLSPFRDPNKEKIIWLLYLRCRTMNQHYRFTILVTIERESNKYSTLYQTNLTHANLLHPFSAGIQCGEGGQRFLYTLTRKFSLTLPSTFTVIT